MVESVLDGEARRARFDSAADANVCASSSSFLDLIPKCLMTFETNTSRQASG